MAFKGPDGRTPEQREADVARILRDKENSMTDDLDRLLSGGAKSATFANPGDTITGIVDNVKVRQATEYGTGKPQTFDNGDPREQIVVTLRADGIPTSDDDDGMRSVYVKGWGLQRRAFIDAVKHAGVDRPTPGDRFTATLLRLEPSKQGGFPAKVFEYRLEPMQASADQAWESATKPIMDAAKVAQLRAFGMDDERIAAALDVPVEAVRDATPF